MVNHEADQEAREEYRLGNQAMGSGWEFRRDYVYIKPDTF